MKTSSYFADMERREAARRGRFNPGQTVRAGLREIYPDPLSDTTAESHARDTHQDLPQLTDEEIDDERLLCRQRLVVENPRRLRSDSERRRASWRFAWLHERSAQLDAEAARRRKLRR